MSKSDKYRGVIPAFYACYDKEGKVDLNAVRRLVDYYVEKGVKGLYVNGSSGECIYLSVEERKQILEAVMERAAGKLTIINHVACNNTSDSMELARHSESCGVDAIASIPPFISICPTQPLRTTGMTSVRQRLIQILSSTIFLSWPVWLCPRAST